MSSDFHVIDLLPAYALDCLDEDEAILVSEHLASCPACRAELASYQDIADQLALGAPDVVPPAGLKRRLMERVRPSRQRETVAPRLSWWQRLVAARPMTPLWRPVALLLIVALAVSNLLLWRQVSRPEATPSLGGMQVVTLAGTDAAPGASGLIISSMDDQYGTLVVDGLPPLDEEWQYQLWLIRDGQRTSGGVFSVAQDGYGSIAISSPEPLLNYSAFGITIEPAGGSLGPTGDKVLDGSL